MMQRIHIPKKSLDHLRSIFLYSGLSQRPLDSVVTNLVVKIGYVRRENELEFSAIHQLFRRNVKIGPSRVFLKKFAVRCKFKSICTGNILRLSEAFDCLGALEYQR